MDPKAIGMIVYGAGDIQQQIAGAVGRKKVRQAQAQALAAAKKETERAYGEAYGYYQPYQEMGDEAYKSLYDMVKEGKFDQDLTTYNYDQYQAPGQYQGPGQAPGMYQDGQYQAPGQYQQPEGQAPYEAPEKFQFDPNQITESPAYQFRLQEGQKAIEGGAAARGSLYSGATLKALAKYGSGLASQEYANEYSRRYGQYADDKAFGRGTYESDRGASERDRAFGYGQYIDDRRLGRGAYEADRSFGAGQATEAYGRYADDRGYGRGVYEQDRSFGRNVYTGDRAMDYGAQQDFLNRQYQQNQNKYGQMQGFAKMGPQTATSLSNLALDRGQSNIDLSTRQAYQDYAKWINAANINIRMGQGAKDFGSMMGGGGMDEMGADTTTKNDMISGIGGK